MKHEETKDEEIANEILGVDKTGIDISRHSDISFSGIVMMTISDHVAYLVHECNEIIISANINLSINK